MEDTENEAFDGLIAMFRRSLRASGKADKTVVGYVGSAVKFARFCADHDYPDDVTLIRREHVEEFIIDLRANSTNSTATTHFAQLQQFFRWLVQVEREIERSPMEGMTRPPIGEDAPNVFTTSELSAILKVCGGADFDDRRDTAIIRLFFDSGLRIAELVGITTEAIDLDAGRVLVRGKGNKQRWAAFGSKTSLSIERYTRTRKRHPKAASDALWIGLRGPMTVGGVSQMLKRRGGQAGVADVHAHRFRHTWSHEYRMAGGQDGDLMVLGGWNSPQMLQRYGRSAKAERAVAAAHAHSLGDRL